MREKTIILFLATHSVIALGELNKPNDDLRMMVEEFANNFPDNFAKLLPLKSETSGLSDNVFENVPIEVRDRTEALEAWVKDFITRLRYYFSTFHFNEQAFGEEVSILEFEMSKILNQAELLRPCPKLTYSLGFARYLLYTMITTWKNMRLYPFMGDEGQHLVHYMSELNIKILALYTESGFPDHANKGFERELKIFTSKIRKWNTEFDHLRVVPSRTRIMFVIQRTRAEELLRVFARYVDQNLNLK